MTLQMLTVLFLIAFVDSQTEQKKLDLTFVLCQSGNTSAEDWKKLVAYVDVIVSNVSIGQDALKVAFVSCSGGNKDAWNLDAHTNREALKDALSQLEQPVGDPDIRKTLNFLHDEIYVKKAGDRPDVQNVVLFSVYGFGNGSDKKVLKAAERCHNAGIEFYARSIGEQALSNTEQVRDIASNPKTRYQKELASIDGMPDVAARIVNILNRSA